jgi:glycosyltransferase involved in cell wall biosynthesis
MSQLPWSTLPPLLTNAETRPTPACSSAESLRAENSEPIPIIALSHLGWDWVWQRPQQFLSRFARRHRVLFVETYRSDVNSTRIELRTPEGHPNVTVLQTLIPSARWDDAGFVDAERRRALQDALAHDLRGRFERPLLWFYDPMAVTAFAGRLRERAIVYDCMDELSQFKDAPAALIDRERALLAVADVVFCGGQKMRKKRLPLNPNTHFFGTGVDVEHFGAALSDKLPLAPEIAALGAAPVLGYFGVIDERIDYELLARLADARDDWHVVMVGPTAKVDPADFPRRRNLHFIGGRPYAQLPALTKGFSVALMPFALNPATEYINPTKALEYMAAGRPIVSTAIDEVSLNFGNVVRVARSPGAFIELCQKETAAPSKSRIARGRKLAAANTWEAIIAQMETHIDAVLAPASAASTAPLPGTQLSRLAYV